MIAREIVKIDPFSDDRNKLKFYDKSRGSSPYYGLTEDWLVTFIDRNKSNFNKIFWNMYN